MRPWFAIALLVGCGSSKDGPTQGQLGGHCYPNGTCDVTLVCMGGLCVADAPDASIDSEDAAVDASVDTQLPDAWLCDPVSASPPDGHHDPGMGCRTISGCHNAQLGLGTNAPEYSNAGTIYQDTGGTTAYAGATVLMTIGGTTTKTVSATNGNFWFVPAVIPSPTTLMTGTTSASACPNTTPMTGALVSGGGDCNNCHRNGGTTLPVYVLP